MEALEPGHEYKNSGPSCGLCHVGRQALPLVISAVLCRGEVKRNLPHRFYDERTCGNTGHVGSCAYMLVVIICITVNGKQLLLILILCLFALFCFSQCL